MIQKITLKSQDAKCVNPCGTLIQYPVTVTVTVTVNSSFSIREGTL